MSQYAWATGHDVSDDSLTSIVSDLTPYNEGVDVVVRSQPINRFPERVTAQDGRTIGDGRIDHALTIAALSRAASAYIQDTYLNGGDDVDAPMTVRFREHDRNAWARYNCYLTLYYPPDDGEYRLGEFQAVQLRFTDLQAL